MQRLAKVHFQREEGIFLGMLSREGDPNSNGRNMAEHFSSRELNLVSQTAVTATQYLNAVGAAWAFDEACAAKGLKPESVRQEIERAQGPGTSERDWRTAPLDEIVNILFPRAIALEHQ